VAGYEVSEKENIAFVDYISLAAFDMFTAVMYGESAMTTDSSMADDIDVQFVKATQTAFDLTGQVLTNPFEKVFQSDTYKRFKISMDKSYSIGKIKTRVYLKNAIKSKEQTQSLGDEGSECPVSRMSSVVENMVKRGTFGLMSWVILPRFLLLFKAP